MTSNMTSKELTEKFNEWDAAKDLLSEEITKTIENHVKTTFADKYVKFTYPLYKPIGYFCNNVKELMGYRHFYAHIADVGTCQGFRYSLDNNMQIDLDNSYYDLTFTCNYDEIPFSRYEFIKESEEIKEYFNIKNFDKDTFCRKSYQFPVRLSYHFFTDTYYIEQESYHYENPVTITFMSKEEFHEIYGPAYSLYMQEEQKKKLEEFNKLKEKLGK